MIDGSPQEIVTRLSRSKIVVLERLLLDGPAQAVICPMTSVGQHIYVAGFNPNQQRAVNELFALDLLRVRLLGQCKLGEPVELILTQRGNSVARLLWSQRQEGLRREAEIKARRRRAMATQRQRERRAKRGRLNREHAAIQDDVAGATARLLRKSLGCGAPQRAGWSGGSRKSEQYTSDGWHAYDAAGTEHDIEEVLEPEVCVMLSEESFERALGFEA